MSSILSKSNSFKRFRSDSANTVSNNGDNESLTSTIHGNSTRPKIFSKKSIKIFGSGNNTSSNFSEDGNNKSNKNIVVRLNDYNKTNSVSSPHLATSTAITDAATHQRNITRTTNMSVGRSLSQNITGSNPSPDKPIHKTEAALFIPEEYLFLIENKPTEAGLIRITLFGKEDRRLKESLILKDDKNYNVISDLLQVHKNKKLDITNFQFEHYLHVLEKIMNLEIQVLEYFIKLTNDNGWVSYKEITQLKQRLNLLVNNWQKRIDFYKQNLCISG